MNKKRMQGLQAEFEKLSTKELEEILQAKLQEETPDSELVTGILAILQERDKDMPLTLTEGDKAAWQKFLSHRESLPAKPAKGYVWALRAACIVAILGICLMAFSGRANANGFWNRIARWTDSVIEFFSPGASSTIQQEYEFRTDHPGLQQVYDAVTKLGITEPVVPMWIPEGYELSYCNEILNEKKITLVSVFQNVDNTISYNVAIHHENVGSWYQKDGTDVKNVEIEGVDFCVVRNYDMWVAIWTVENIECSISVDCREEELYQILRSIYDKEETV